MTYIAENIVRNAIIFAAEGDGTIDFDVAEGMVREFVKDPDEAFEAVDRGLDTLVADGTVAEDGSGFYVVAMR